MHNLKSLPINGTTNVDVTQSKIGSGDILKDPKTQEEKKTGAGENGMAGTTADAKNFDKQGRLVRAESAFRNFVSSEPGAEFPLEAGRYHIYIALACPWAMATYYILKNMGL